MNDLISVIVNIYNNEKSLRDCIISIIGQTYRNLEIILVDDGSTDGSGKICDDLILTSSKMKLVHRIHSGLGDSRNVGLDMSTGKYVTFVNGSDRIKSDMIENLYKIMQSYPVDMSMCSCYTPEMSQSNTSTIITLSSEDAIRQLLIGKSIGNTVCGKLFKKSLFYSIKFISASIDFRIHFRGK